METTRILNYSEIFLATYFNNDSSCTHRNHEHVLVYVYAGELDTNERGETTLLHAGMCAFLRRDNQVQLTKRGRNGEQFKAIFMRFPRKFLREFYQAFDKKQMPDDSKRDKISVHKLPADRPDITSLFQSMTPYFDSSIQPAEQLLHKKMAEGVYVLLNTDKKFYATLFDFTELWKIDIFDYLNEHKMVMDVMVEVGFKNLSHFSKVYKEAYGYAPTKLRCITNIGIR